MLIILIRGLAREAGHWGGFTKILENKLTKSKCKNIKIITPDIAGCGKYHLLTTPNSINKITDQLRISIINDYKNSIESNKNIVLIGLSLGGMIALDWLQRYPNEIDKTCVINSSLGEHPILWRVKASVFPLLIVGLFIPRKLLEKLILRKVSNEKNREKFIDNLRLWIEIYEKRPVRLTSIINMLLAASNFKLNNQITSSGLVITSTKDRFVNYKSSEDIAARLGWDIYYHKLAGHDLSLDAPDWLSDKIVTWLEPKK